MKGWYYPTLFTFLEASSILLAWSALNDSVRHAAFIKKLLFPITFVLLNVTLLVINPEVWITISMNFFVIFLFFIYVYRVNIKNLFFEFFLAHAMVIILQVFYTYIYSFFTVENDFSRGLTVNLGLLITMYFIDKKNLLKSIQRLYIKYTQLTLSILLNIFLCALISMAIWRVDRGFMITYFPLIIVIIILWGIINFYFMFQRVKIIQQKKVISTHETYLPYLEGLVDEVRQRQHDFKNHLNVIYEFAEEVALDTNKEMKEYLDKLIKRDRPMDYLLNINDSILTAIIYNKKNVIKEKGINFDFKINDYIPKYPLEKYEVVEILGNLLDNAMEEIENIGNIDHKNIALTLGTYEDKSIIEVKNTRNANKPIELDKIFDRGFSTKEGKNRGYGLYNVKKIVNYYNGKIELSLDNEDIIFRLLF
ncbi:two-component system sensor histidine kinase AgrC [Natranaerovirga pectinivora]|uniref:Two-component system sensor histidine kinase AgrC n=1 Tax=Natranaerovirga pectinivora TaxID=682400 RepID=A0A4R3MRN6_9FIRM|nr:GHKL domain-containing protein [Natranaerovirga pectinivora]TCT15447.1 two-component system sensor histidine kinase AgrC [Natranaerovirga pectinivora]